MKNESLTVFVESIANFFKTHTKTEVDIGTPFLIDNINKYLSDYTGIISISGNHKGSVFFTMPSRMAIHLLSEMGLMSTQDEKLMDLVGEVCNTVAGNARREFGDQFILSVPIMFKGETENIKVHDVASIYIIPVVWQGIKSHLIINLNGE